VFLDASMDTLLILLASQDSSLCATVSNQVASKTSYQVEIVSALDVAVSKVTSPRIAMAMLHVQRAGDVLSVAQFLYEAKRRSQPISTLVLLDHPHEDVILRLLQIGAVECLCRPLDLSRLALLIDTLLPHPAKLDSASSRRRAACTPKSDSPTRQALVCSSPAMRSIMDKVKRAAVLNTTVLLEGETGSGKTHLARQIHALSPRAGKPLVHVNCGALAPTLVESELFGHVKGAFTGADRDFQGKFAQAADGTIFLDEIDCMSLETQAKFLRVVEERVFEPLGSGRRQSVAARLIVATNRSLDQQVAAGRFRADLMYRLNVVAFQLPPLRERRDEIRPLLADLLAGIAEQHALPCPAISDEAVWACEAYDWPGNVRELRNVAEHAMVMCSNGAINLADLPECVQRCARIERPREEQARPMANLLACARESAERAEVIAALRRNDDNRSSAAADLGISRVALYKKLRKYGLV
jgi:DNA-binding NtrC family response regulator